MKKSNHILHFVPGARIELPFSSMPLANSGKGFASCSLIFNNDIILKTRLV